MHLMRLQGGGSGFGVESSVRKHLMRLQSGSSRCGVESSVRRHLMRVQKVLGAKLPLSGYIVSTRLSL